MPPIIISVDQEVHFPDPYAGLFAHAMSVKPGDRVLDLGCGAGVYGLYAAVKGAGEVVFTDINPIAVRCALRNAIQNEIKRVKGRVGSLFVPLNGERFDVIITSLPQLPAPERIIPERYGGPDGLRYLRRLAARAVDYLNPGGRIYLLITDWAWPPRVEDIFNRKGFRLHRLVRVERAFQPAEYNALTPGLFDYLDRRAQRGLAAYRRKGAWCYLGIGFFEAIPDGCLSHVVMST